MPNATVKNKKYYNKNRDIILANQREKVVCLVCNIWIAKSSKAKHVKRKNHIFNMGICQEIADVAEQSAMRIKQLEQQKKRRANDSVVEL